jgi:hypothetical protein
MDKCFELVDFTENESNKIHSSENYLEKFWQRLKTSGSTINTSVRKGYFSYNPPLNVYEPKPVFNTFNPPDGKTLRESQLDRCTSLINKGKF